MIVGSSLTVFPVHLSEVNYTPLVAPRLFFLTHLPQLHYTLQTKFYKCEHLLCLKLQILQAMVIWFLSQYKDLNKRDIFYSFAFCQLFCGCNKRFLIHCTRDVSCLTIQRINSNSLETSPDYLRCHGILPSFSKNRWKVINCYKFAWMLCDVKITTLIPFLLQDTKKFESRGWHAWVVWGGKQKTITPILAASLIKHGL